MTAPDLHRRSPRAERNERQARITRLLVAMLLLVTLAAAGYGVSLFRKWKDVRPSHGPGAASSPASRGTHSETAPASSRAAPRIFPAAAAIADLSTRHADPTPESRWALATALRDLSAAWRADGAEDSDVNRLLAAALDAERWILDHKPSFAPLRALRKEARLADLLAEHDDFDTRFLTKSEAARLEVSVRDLRRAADRNAGWVAIADFERGAGPLVAKARAAHAPWDAMMQTRAGKAARQIEIRDLAALNTTIPTARFRVFYHLPYVVLVERDDRWEESEPAMIFARRLHGLARAFFAQYGQPLGLGPDRHRPVSVVVFASREGYHRYVAARGDKDVLGTEAHFEPKEDRLVLHAECDVATVLHEGTHQLVRANVRAPLETHAQSFWFHEGIAEWFAGSRESGAHDDGVPRYEPGHLLPQDVTGGAFLGPLGILRALPPSQRTPLSTLCGIMLQDRDALAARGQDGARRIRQLYAEGWFLIYFLNHFNVDDAGLVDVAAPGVHRALWLDYLKREMGGASGAGAFRDALAGANVTLDRLEQDHASYLAFVLRKIARGEVRDQKLAPSPDGDRLVQR